MKICWQDNMENNLEILLEALECYGIQVLSVEGNQVCLPNNYTVEVESNGIYRLIDDGYVVAPFGELNELCQFILG
ncbi:MAG: hypothetical protein ABIX01_00650 [Chitinophagaceae bacterium]